MCVVVAFLVALVLRRLEARRLGIAAAPGQRLIGIAALAGAVVGSKLGMALFEPWPALGDLFRRAAGFDFAGKTVVGALLGGIAGVEIAKWRLGIRRRTGDQFAIAAALGIGIGRVGCLLNGCCYGTPGGGPLAVDIAGASRHPVQAYEAAALLVLAAGLWATRRADRPEGRLWREFLIGFFAIRFSTEFLRGDPAIRFGPVSLVQAVCLAAIAAFALQLRAPRPAAAAG